MVVTAGHRGDSPQFIPVLRRIRVTRLGVGRPRTCPDRVLADKAYTSRGNRALPAHDAGSRRCIPSKTDQDAHRKAKGSQGRPPTRLRPRALPASATPSSAASTGSNATAPSPPATTSSPSATKPPLHHHHHQRVALTVMKHALAARPRSLPR